MRVEGFIKHAGVAIQHQHVGVADVSVRPTIAIGGSAFDGRGDGERSHCDVTFVGVVNHRDRNHGGCGGIDDDVGDAVVSSGNGRPVVMQMEASESRRGSNGRIVRVERGRGDVGVPCGAGCEWKEAVQAGIVSETHACATGAGR